MRTAGTRGLREELRRSWPLARRLEPVDPQAPVPPPSLPPGHVVEVPGRGEVFVRRSSAGPDRPTILLLHGWTASADLNWWRVYEPLAQLGSVVAVDHRGHGRGMRSVEPFSLEAAADDAAGVLGVLGISSAVVCGYSMGGPIGLLLWERHRDLVDGLVLQATALEWRATLRERLMWRTMGIVEYILRLGAPRGVIDRLLRQAIETSPDLEPYQGWITGELRRGDPTDLANAGRALGRFDARPFASRIAVPTVVVVTTGDRLVRPGKQRQLARAITGAEVMELDADHDAALVSAGPFPEVTTRAMRAVLPRVEASTGEVHTR